MRNCYRESGDAEPPIFAEPALPEYKIASRRIHQAAVTLGVAVVCQVLGLNGVKQRMESREARVMQSYGGAREGGADTVVGWTKAKRFLGGGKVPLSENTKAVWARQDKAKKATKAADEKRTSSLVVYGDISRFFDTSIPQLELPLPDFNKCEGGDEGEDIAEGVFRLQVRIGKNKPDLQSQGGSVLTPLGR